MASVNTAKSTLSFCLCITLVLSANLPTIDTNNAQTARQALQQVFGYLSDDELTTFDLSASNAFTSPIEMYDPESYLPNNGSLPFNLPNNTNWQEIFQTYMVYATEQCTALQLDSQACFYDCIYYNNILTWIQLIVSNDTAAQYQLTRMMGFYSMGAGPLSYQDAGNPDMCQLTGGTYCYTPALASIYTQQHACCVPGTCVGDDALKIVTSNNWCYKGFETYAKRMIGVQSLTPVCEPMERELNKAGPIIVIVVFFIFVLFVIIASIIKRYCMEYTHENGSDELRAVANKNTFISSFNIESLWQSFGAVRPAEKSQYNFLDGMRVWSMTWVILGHSYLFFLMSGASNLPTFTGEDTNYTYLVQKFYTIFIQYAFYSVDSFFFLSGFLAAFSIWRNIQKYGDKALRLSYLWIPMAYLMRILRIVPMMMFVTAMQWQLSDQIPYGYHVLSRHTYTEYCDKAWYKILFFYANLTLSPDSSEALNCMGHLWYIQCDMQMFLLLPFLVLIFAYNKLFGLIASFVPTLVCLIIRFYYAFHYDFTANVVDPGYPPKNGGKQDVQSYYEPWTRMSVYFIGVSLMFLMVIIDHKAREHKKYVLNKTSYFALIWAASFIMLCLVVWPYQDVEDQPNDRWSLLSNQFYFALGRPAWGFGLALLTFALKYINGDGSETKQKSMIKAFLSLEVYQSLGKLTYLMYLLHLLVFAWWSSDLEFPAYYNEWNELLLVIGVWFIVAILALLLWFVMEKPIANVTTAFGKSIMKCGGHKKRYSKSVNEEPLLFDNMSDEDDHKEENEDAYVRMGSINNQSEVVVLDGLNGGDTNGTNGTTQH